MVIHLWALKSGNQMVYGCEPRLQSWCGARHRKGNDRSICVCVCVRVCVCVSLINRLTTKRGLDLSLSKLLSAFPSSVVFIHPYFSQRLSCVPLLSMPTSTRRCGFQGLMSAGCSSRCCMCVCVCVCVCVWCRPVLAGACFSSPDWSWMRTAELVTSGSPLSAGEALWWTPEWWFPQRRRRTKLSWGGLCLTWVINAG